MTDNSINMENIDAQIDKIMENGDNKDSVREAVHQCAADGKWNELINKLPHNLTLI